jgi:NAD(P)-dependent dehydrogenase (short-subunit alcohol dehydrogenase family)
VPSDVVRGGARGIGRAIAERLAREGRVVVLDLGAPDWTHERVVFTEGDASDETVTERAAQAAGDELSGWAGNAAVFRDAAGSPAPLVVASTSARACTPAGCTR